MQRLAEFTLRGPVYAAGVAAVAMLVPFLFWVGAAVTGLVTLRLGPGEGFKTGLWAFLPGALWLFWGSDPAPLMVLALTLAMAVTLRVTVSWEQALLGGALASAVLAQVIPWLAPDFFGLLMETAQTSYSELEANLGEEASPGEAGYELRDMMLAAVGFFLYAMAILSTGLARGWQARLFNPEGLRREFHGFHLTVPVAVGLLLVIATAQYLSLAPITVTAVAAVPLTLAGLALVHGLIAKRGLGGGWLIGFYVALVILAPWLFLVLMIAAVIDSGFDVRQRF